MHANAVQINFPNRFSVWVHTLFRFSTSGKVYEAVISRVRNAITARTEPFRSFASVEASALVLGPPRNICPAQIFIQEMGSRSNRTIGTARRTESGCLCMRLKIGSAWIHCARALDMHTKRGGWIRAKTAVLKCAHIPCISFDYSGQFCFRKCKRLKFYNYFFVGSSTGANFLGKTSGLRYQHFYCTKGNEI